MSTRTAMEHMSRTPNYHDYTLRELYSVARAVDREEFPDRYALVIQEIRRREEEGLTPMPRPSLFYRRKEQRL